MRRLTSFAHAGHYCRCAVVRRNSVRNCRPYNAGGTGNMKRLMAALIICVFASGIATPAYATGEKGSDRFANTEPLETMARSRTDAADAAAQVPGAAGVLLEALRWQGRTAKQI